jgi:hypothetical protein
MPLIKIRGDNYYDTGEYVEFIVLSPQATFALSGLKINIMTKQA